MLRDPYCGILLFSLACILYLQHALNSGLFGFMKPNPRQNSNSRHSPNSKHNPNPRLSSKSHMGISLLPSQKMCRESCCGMTWNCRVLGALGFSVFWNLRLVRTLTLGQTRTLGRAVKPHGCETGAMQKNVEGSMLWQNLFPLAWILFSKTQKFIRMLEKNVKVKIMLLRKILSKMV